MSPKTVLQVSGLAKHFGGVRALDGVDFEVSAGQCVALIGPNGAGKSTCFACLAGQQVPTAGEVLWHGQSLLGKPPAARQRLGVARTFQVAQTFEALTVLQNIQLVLGDASPLAWWDRLDRRQPERALQLAEQAGLQSDWNWPWRWPVCRRLRRGQRLHCCCWTSPLPGWLWLSGPR
jgi:branched-chain amino acid transport system ATP-binding protein